MAKGGRGLAVANQLAALVRGMFRANEKCRLRKKCNDNLRGNPEGGMSTLGEPDAVKIARPVRRREWGNVLKSNALCSYPTTQAAKTPGLTKM
jgi:hypothetical protein